MTPYEAFCREAAAARGIFPDTAVMVANNEGGLEKPAVPASFPTGTSYWAFQLHYAGGTNPTPGMGDDFTKLTGWRPGDPAAWRDAMRFALNRARRDGWGAWYGARKIGVTGFYGIDRSVPWDAKAETWDYERPKEQSVPNRLTTTDDANFRPAPSLSTTPIQTLKKGSPVWPTGSGKVTADGHVWVPVALAPVGWIAEELLTGGGTAEPIVTPSPFYNSDYPVSTQEHDWDCAQDSTWWALRALGRKPDNAWMEQMMLTGGVESTDVGLTDGTGQKLAAWINGQYEPEIHAYAIPDISFAQASHLAGTTAVLLGGHNWHNGMGHWVALRRHRDDVLELANPGGRFSKHYGQQTLDRAAWDAKAPWSAVVIERKA